ncbi:MAG: hypothetical protein HKN75_03190 [Bacteroidia bacterium]|nr:hypothetical protein [Bacteroidia bacterium]
MPARLIKKVIDGSVIAFDKGTFDEWCVFLQRPHLKRYAPKDTEYFSALKEMGTAHGPDTIYKDFVYVYRKTTHEIDAHVTSLITRLSHKYKSDSLMFDIWMSVIYGGMIAEENKENAILKKRIKRLGMHQVLVEGMEPKLAANFSKGMKWGEIDKICKEKGF